jgi:adenosine kinase
MMEGAALYIVNDYEWALTLEKTGLDEDAIASRVGALIVTRGGEGSRVRRGGGSVEVRMDGDGCDVAVVKADEVVDPTGCGDAYRAGILYALAQDLPLETGARIGSLLGSLKVELAGPQSLEMDLAEFRTRYEKEYGEGF